MSDIGTGLVLGKNIGDLSQEELRLLGPGTATNVACALSGALHLRECELARTKLELAQTLYNYAALKITTAHAEVERADRRNKGDFS